MDARPSSQQHLLKAETNDRDALFFRDVVRTYTDDQRHLPRDWLADLIDRKLAQADTRYVVVTGAPGSGKSAMIAELTGHYPGSLVYFLRRDQTKPLAEGSAKSFLVRLGFQFASLHPEVFEDDALRVEIMQSAGTTQVGSDVIGARIGRLLASPFYQTIIRIRQQAGSVGGRLTGLEINELVSDPRLLRVSDLQALALWTPAGILLKKQPTERLIILIDALDELAREAPAQDLDIVSWLRDQPELPANVRFVVTSRPGGAALDAFLEKQAPFIARVQLEPDDELVRSDVATYTRALASQMRERKILSDDAAEKRFIDEATSKANGNLGYVGAVARAFDHALTSFDRQTALQSLLKLDQLPPTLQDLYAFFFHQLRARVARHRVEIHGAPGAAPGILPAWPAVYCKALAILSIAYEPLTTDQIADLGQIAVDRGYVVDALENLEQFLQRDPTDRRARLYHPLVAEFLTGATTRSDEALFIDRMSWNRQLAARLEARFAHEPDTLDDYAIKYRIRHHIAGNGPESAHAAMTSEWMLLKRRRTGSDRSFHADLMEVIPALREQVPLNIVAIVRCCAMDAVLLARVTELPPTVASIWAMCGQRAHAESLISLISNPGNRAEAFLQLARGLRNSGAIEPARGALRSAVAAAKSNPYYVDRLETLTTVLASGLVDASVASLVLDTATMTEATIPAVAGTELSWEHSSLAFIYEGAAPFLPMATLGELHGRVQHFLQKPGDARERMSILISAAIVSDRLGNGPHATSMAESGFAEARRLPGIDSIKALCAAAYHLKNLTDQKPVATALALALERLREGLNPVAEAYAIALIAKSGLETVTNFDTSQVNIERAYALARDSLDAAVFEKLAGFFAARHEEQRAIEAADLCYQTVLNLHGGNEERFTRMVHNCVISAFRVSRHRSGLLQLMEVAAGFDSPGYEWERDSLVHLVSNVAGELKFTDVLERALVIAQDTRDTWERASALSRVGKAYAMTDDRPRALAIARSVEDIVAAGLRAQFPRRFVRGALLLAAASLDPVQATANLLTEDSADSRYLAVTRALVGDPEESESLQSVVERLLKRDIARMPLYLLLKKAVAANDLDALAAVERWERDTGNAIARETVERLRKLALKADPQSLIEAARFIVDSFDRLDVIPEDALAVIDALVTAGLSDEAASIVARLTDSARRPHPDANVQVAWEAAAFVASQRLSGGIGFQQSLVALLDHAREVGMLSTARTIADTATAIATLFGAPSAIHMLGPLDEVAALE